LALFDITLHTSSNKGCDAITPNGRMVEIKATYRADGVNVRRSSNGIADDLLALKLSKHGGVEVVFKGPYSVAHTLIVDRRTRRTAKSRCGSPAFERSTGR
jgi:hypothetical protein